MKVSNGVISQAIPGGGADLTTSLEIFQAAGKSAGLVTSHTPITDATPAAFGAHEPTRDNHSQIAGDFFADSRPQTRSRRDSNSRRIASTQPWSPSSAASAAYWLTLHGLPVCWLWTLPIAWMTCAGPTVQPMRQPVIE